MPDPHTPPPPTTSTVGDLVDALARYPSQTPVRLAINPRWPFAHHVGAVVTADDTGDPERVRTVYVTEAGQEDYLPPAVRLRLGWH